MISATVVDVCRTVLPYNAGLILEDSPNIFQDTNIPAFHTGVSNDGLVHPNSAMCQKFKTNSSSID